MTPASRSKILWLVAAGFIGLIFLQVLLSPDQRPGTLDLRVADMSQTTNGAMLFTLVLTNGSPNELNVIDDTSGKPFFILDDGVIGPPNGTIGLGLSKMANMGTVNLAPGATLTNTVMLTNPPPRFRFRVESRDFAAERRQGVKQLFRIIASKATLQKPTPSGATITLPSSDWIEPAAVPTTNLGATGKVAAPD